MAFDDVITRLEAVGPRALPPRGRELLVQAYEYRGRAYYNIGLSEKASENFRQLVQLAPDHALSKDRVSPKIVELFNSVKRSLVGYLAVSSKPAGAQVTLVGPGEAAERSRPDRLLPGRGAGGGVHGRGRAPGLQDGDAPRQPRGACHAVARDRAGAGAGEPLLRHPARGRRDLDRWRAARHDDPRARARSARGRAGARARSGAGLGAHRGGQPLARQPRDRVPSQVLRDGAAHRWRRRRRRTTRPTRSASRSRSRRCAWSRTRPGRASC